MNLPGALRVALLIALAATRLVADVTYTKSVRYTGGTMLGFLRNLVGSPLIQRLVGADLQAALEDQSYTVYIKGAKMAQVADSGSTIYDLGAGTITSLDRQNETYSVETFDDLRGQIERAQQWMKHSKTEFVAFDVNVQKTEERRSLEGRTASKSLITLTAQSESAWGRPVLTTAAWLVPVSPATRPLYDFAKRAAAKLGTVFTLIPSFFGAAADGSGTVTSELEKLNGISVLDQISVTGVSNPITRLFGRAGESNSAVITLQIQSSNFSAEPIDRSRFVVPAQYREQSRIH